MLFLPDLYITIRDPGVAGNGILVYLNRSVHNVRYLR
jgi:hypothetical protein